MDVTKRLILKTYKHFMHDSLYRNSIFLMANTVALSIFGFVFWAIAAHLYPSRNIGIAAALLSAVTLITSLSTLGFDVAFVHYLPKSKTFFEKTDTGLTTAAISSLMISAVYLLIIRMLTPKLGFLDDSAILILSFGTFMIINLFNNLTNNLFVVCRAANLILITNCAFGILRLILLFFFVHLGLLGLILSHTIATLFSVILSFYFLRRKINYIYTFRIIKKDLGQMAAYASGSYIANILSTLPLLVLPIIIVNDIGARQAAYYYIISMIISAVNIIPQATSLSLFAEGSWDKSRFRHNLVKSLTIIIPLVSLAVFILIIEGRFILNLFGKEYSQNGYILLILVSIAAIPKIISLLGTAALRIRGEVKATLQIYFAYSVIVISLSLIGISKGQGLKAIGEATLIGELVSAILYIILFRKIVL